MIEKLLCLGFISLYLLNCVWFCYVQSLNAIDIYARRFEYSCMRCLCSTGNNRCSYKNCEGLLTINKINIIRWNIYRDNNFHSQREVLRVKCLWKSWVRYKLIYVVSGLPGVCSFSRWTRGKKIYARLQETEKKKHQRQ